MRIKATESVHVTADVKILTEDQKVDIDDAHLDDPSLREAVCDFKKDTVQLLLTKGAKTYFANPKSVDFHNPIQLAEKIFQTATSAQKIKIVDILELLLQHRTPIDADYLEQHLAFCREFYQTDGEASANNNTALLNYSVSRLTGINMNLLLNKGENVKTLLKYITHRNEIRLYLAKKEVPEKKINVDDHFDKMEGWREDEFLPLRVRALFELILRIELGELGKKVTEPVKTLTALRNELLIELETLQIMHGINAIKTCTRNNKTPQQLEKLSKAFARNIDKRRTEWKLSEYCIPAGWSEHSVYISFTQNSVIRLDNLGEGCDKHKKGTTANSRYPYIIYHGDLSKLTIAPYLADVIRQAADPKSKGDQAIPIIYNKTGKLGQSPAVLPPPESLNYPSSPEQKAGTCVYASHTVGVQIRIPELYTLVHTEELQTLTRLSDQPVRSLDPLGSFWKKFKEPRGLPTRVLQTYKVKCQAQEKIRLLLDGRELAIDQSYINLTITEEITPKEKKVAKEKIKDEKDKKSAEQSINSIDSLQRHKTVKTIKVDNIFKHCVNKKQVLVFGQAGIGKSTFCQYVTHQWASGKLWSGQFEWVFRIPLRHLTTNRYPIGKNYSEVDILIKECMPEETLSDWMIPLLQQALNKDKVLWLLDGHDELPSPLPIQLTNVWNKLLAKTNLIITSRYHSVNDSPITTCLEIIGFTDENVKAYITQFFSTTIKPPTSQSRSLIPDEKDTKSASIPTHSTNLLHFLETNPNLKEITRVPIQLELICSVWQDANSQLLSSTSITLSELYYQITLWLLRRRLQKTGIVSDELVDDHKVLRWLNTELQALEKIAFSLMQKNSLVLTDTDFKKLIPHIVDDKTLHEEIFKLGILKRMDNSATPDAEFIHLTFQEFFAARYLVNGLMEIEGKRFTEAMQFIREQKYQRRLAIVFWFTSGLLSLNKTPSGEKALQLFWQAIESSPRDLVGRYHLELVALCLEEAGCDSRIPQQPGLFLDIKNYLTLLIEYSSDYSSEHQRWLLPGSNASRVLKRSINVFQRIPSVLKHSGILGDLPEKLNNLYLRFALAALEAIGPAAATHPDILTPLTAMLSDKSADIRETAAQALGAIGPAAATHSNALTAVITTLKDKDAKVREAAAQALGKMGSAVLNNPKVLPALVATLQNKDIDWHIRDIQNVIDILGAMGSAAAQNPKVLPTLIATLEPEERDWETRVGNREYIPSLECIWLRKSAAKALGTMGSAAADARLVLANIVAPDDDDEWEFLDLRRNAVDALRLIGSAAADDRELGIVLAALEYALWRDPTDEDLQVRAAKALGQMGSIVADYPVTLRTLVDNLEEGAQDEPVRESIADALGLIGSAATANKNVLRTFINILKNKEDYVEVRASVANALYRAPPTSGDSDLLTALRTVLVEILKDKEEDHDLRAEAIRALKAIGIASTAIDKSNLLTVLVNIFKDKDDNHSVRKYAAQAIGSMGLVTGYHEAQIELRAALMDEDMTEFALSALDKLPLALNIQFQLEAEVCNVKVKRWCNILREEEVYHIEHWDSILRTALLEGSVLTFNENRLYLFDPQGRTHTFSISAKHTQCIKQLLESCLKQAKEYRLPTDFYQTSQKEVLDALQRKRSAPTESSSASQQSSASTASSASNPTSTSQLITAEGSSPLVKRPRITTQSTLMSLSEDEQVMDTKSTP